MMPPGKSVGRAGETAADAQWIAVHLPVAYTLPSVCGEMIPCTVPPDRRLRRRGGCWRAEAGPELRLRTLDSGSSSPKGVEVRVLSSAPIRF
jgi:hypothetical protein